MILHINNLSKSFSRNNSKTTVLENISFFVNKGEFICIVGPSGCGKSTLLKQIGSFDIPDKGTIFLNDKTVRKPGLNRIMVFQDFDQLFPWKTVIQNVLFPLQINKISNSRQEQLQTAKKYLSMVNLAEYINYYPHQLSGGMKQRTAIARALAINPDILLMDEPFGSLDAQTRTSLQQMLLTLWNNTNTTIIFVTHDIQEAILLADKIIVMGKNPGHIKKIIENPLSRPRKPVDSNLSDMYNQIYKLLEENKNL
jgi:NitT/TauT family transport system ATP-binding protein